ncbi:corticotropin-releasing factor receptor 2 isoform X3 [Desmodus rotundus]|uniref:corticotropin-releasing factor receptor 2 isoform X3 n=1 Tax=Desmodus rotundus TaxID=9430 RepID=UPI00238173D3|nr:corticotropin-releasing factor receptor 2 isoform X3 [Desmodus rotundus]
MEVALLHSLLEANCSMALAEELFSDGWAQPLDPEGPYSYCNTTLDQIGTCWPRSAAGALVERQCPEYFNGVKYNTTRNAYRECLENGTWASRINYSQCVPILDDTQRKYSLHYHIALVVNYLGHCVSVAALTAAFLLFLALRSIRCLRNVIHWNLITTFILRNVTWFLLQLIDHEVHESNEVWCRCITVVFNYFVVTNFFWMFVEGCYLHTAIVMAYSTERLRKWLFLFIGWCIPFPITLAWALGKLYYENEQCWFGKEPGDIVDYIYQGPIILVLLEAVMGKACGTKWAPLWASRGALCLSPWTDELRVSVQYRQDPNDKITSIHHVRGDPVQEGGEGHPGPPAPAGHHLHAVPRQPRGGRPVADRVHLFQLLPAVLPGLLCVCLLLLLKWRGTLSREEEVAPVAGPSLPPCPQGPGHVHPHLTHEDQLPQHQADRHRVTRVSPPRPPLCGRDSFPVLLRRPLWALLARQPWCGQKGGESPALQPVRQVRGLPGTRTCGAQPQRKSHRKPGEDVFRQLCTPASHATP